MYLQAIGQRRVTDAYTEPLHDCARLIECGTTLRQRACLVASTLERRPAIFSFADFDAARRQKAKAFSVGWRQDWSLATLPDERLYVRMGRASRRARWQIAHAVYALAHFRERHPVSKDQAHRLFPFVLFIATRGKVI
jgi:hypothetical protein